MLKGLVTLTNSVICPLSYNCMCPSCFGGGTRSRQPSGPLPGASCTIAEPKFMESEPGSGHNTPLWLWVAGTRRSDACSMPRWQVLFPSVTGTFPTPHSPHQCLISCLGESKPTSSLFPEYMWPAVSDHLQSLSNLDIPLSPPPTCTPIGLFIENKDA